MFSKDKLALFAFFVSGLGLAFFGGIAVDEFKLPPYELIRETKNGIEALMLIEDRDEVPAFAFDAPDRKPGTHVKTLSPKAGTEPLLVTGGFFQYMSKCPDFGCIAWISDREGNVLHKWEIDPAAITEGATGFDNGLSPYDIRAVGTRLVDDGGLLVTFHTRNSFPYVVGIAKLDADSNLVWKRLDGAHHWFDTDAAGNIYVPYDQPVENREYYSGTAILEKCPLDRYHGGGIAVLDRNGQLLRSFNVTELLVRNGFPGLLYSLRDACDPHHVNSVEYLTAEMASTVPGAAAGDLLVSFRENNMIAILDSRTGEIHRAIVGKTTAQHSPKLLHDGTIAVFDNRGGDIRSSGTRILDIDPVTQETKTLFPRADTVDDLLPFWSADGGHIDVSADGKRLMVSSNTQARTIEIDVKTGEAYWTAEKIFDITPYLETQGAEGAPSIVGFNAYGTYYLKNSELAFLNTGEKRRASNSSASSAPTHVTALPTLSR